MKKIFLVILIAVLITGAIYVNALNIPSVNNLIYYSLCDKPIKYRVDTVDPQFNLSKQEFLLDINKAAQIWNNATDKKLFEYDPNGGLSINLIYDERQTLTSKISQLENTIQSGKQTLNPKVEEYEKRSLEFKKKVEELNKKIQEWNSRGGAPPDEYNKIIDEQKSLQAEADSLNSMAQSLNISTREYNLHVNQLNQTIKNFNEALEERPEEGIYKGPENRIEIYFNVTKSGLIHTIAHELGHALGLEHVNNPKAIMYSKTNQSIALSDDDLNSLNTLCRQRNIFEPIQRYIINTFQSFSLN